MCVFHLAFVGRSPLGIWCTWLPGVLRSLLGSIKVRTMQLNQLFLIVRVGTTFLLAFFILGWSLVLLPLDSLFSSSTRMGAFPIVHAGHSGVGEAVFFNGPLTKLGLLCHRACARSSLGWTRNGEGTACRTF